VGQISPENYHPDGRFLSEFVAKFFVRSKLNIWLYFKGRNTILHLSRKFQPNLMKNLGMKSLSKIIANETLAIFDFRPRIHILATIEL
jgi:hypothetical protein